MDFLYAAAQPGQSGSNFTAFLPFILIIVIIYFLMIRPQSKRQKEKESMRDSLKKGDKYKIREKSLHGKGYTFLYKKLVYKKWA